MISANRACRRLAVCVTAIGHRLSAISSSQKIRCVLFVMERTRVCVQKASFLSSWHTPFIQKMAQKPNFEMIIPYAALQIHYKKGRKWNKIKIFFKFFKNFLKFVVKLSIRRIETAKQLTYKTQRPSIARSFDFSARRAINFCLNGIKSDHGS